MQINGNNSGIYFFKDRKYIIISIKAERPLSKLKSFNDKKI